MQPYSFHPARSWGRLVTVVTVSIGVTVAIVVGVILLGKRAERIEALEQRMEAERLQVEAAESKAAEAQRERDATARSLAEAHRLAVTLMAAGEEARAAAERGRQELEAAAEREVLAAEVARQREARAAEESRQRELAIRATAEARIREVEARPAPPRAPDNPQPAREPDNGGESWRDRAGRRQSRETPQAAEQQEAASLVRIRNSTSTSMTFQLQVDRVANTASHTLTSGKAVTLRVRGGRVEVIFDGSTALGYQETRASLKLVHVLAGGAVNVGRTSSWNTFTLTADGSIKLTAN